MSNLKEKQVQDYLTYLANEKFVAVATQNKTLQSILLLYREVLDSPLDELKFNRSRKPKRLPTVLNREEVISILTKLDGEAKLMVSLLYGWGLRQNECLSLRYEDLDLERMEVTIRGAKGIKDRNVTIPEKLKEPLQSQRGVDKKGHNGGIQTLNWRQSCYHRISHPLWD